MYDVVGHVGPVVFAALRSRFTVGWITHNIGSPASGIFSNPDCSILRSRHCGMCLVVKLAPAMAQVVYLGGTIKLISDVSTSRGSTSRDSDPTSISLKGKGTSVRGVTFRMVFEALLNPFPG
jgi:hypothetical protein